MSLLLITILFLYLRQRMGRVGATANLTGRLRRLDRLREPHQLDRQLGGRVWYIGHFGIFSRAQARLDTSLDSRRTNARLYAGFQAAWNLFLRNSCPELDIFTSAHTWPSCHVRHDRRVFHALPGLHAYRLQRCLCAADDVTDLPVEWRCHLAGRREPARYYHGARRAVPYLRLYGVPVCGVFVWLAIDITRSIRSRDPSWLRRYSIEASWIIAGMLVFIAVQIKFPNYFIYLMIPLFVYLGMRIRDVASGWLAAQRRHPRLLRTGRTGLIALLAFRYCRRSWAFYLAHRQSK